MAQRKYAVEVALQLTTTYWQLLQPDGLGNAQTYAASTGADFNIYAILERPRLQLDPASLKPTGRIVEGIFTACGPIPTTHRFRVPLGYPAKDRLTVDSPYPYTHLRILDADVELSDSKLALLSPWIATDYRAMNHYKVSYVGQAQGNIRDRDAMERLKNHETLQRIMADILLERPHSDLWLLLVDFEPSMMTHMGATSPSATSSVEESMDHLARVESNIASDRSQLINLVEAGLIRYFQPIYNERYKKTFPSPEHSTYTAAYENDINAVVIGLTTTEPYAVELHSDAVATSSIHVVSYPLHDRTLREYMFDLFGMGAP